MMASTSATRTSRTVIHSECITCGLDLFRSLAGVDRGPPVAGEEIRQPGPVPGQERGVQAGSLIGGGDGRVGAIGISLPLAGRPIRRWGHPASAPTRNRQTKPRAAGQPISTIGARQKRTIRRTPGQQCGGCRPAKLAVGNPWWPQSCGGGRDPASTAPTALRRNAITAGIPTRWRSRRRHRPDPGRSGSA